MDVISHLLSVTCLIQPAYVRRISMPYGFMPLANRMTTFLFSQNSPPYLLPSSIR